MTLNKGGCKYTQRTGLQLSIKIDNGSFAGAVLRCIKHEQSTEERK